MIVAKPNSTCIVEATYDTKRHDMTIEFARGGRYKYADVPESVYHAIVTAPSVGRAFHATIRGHYATTRI